MSSKEEKKARKKRSGKRGHSVAKVASLCKTMSRLSMERLREIARGVPNFEMKPHELKKDLCARLSAHLEGNDLKPEERKIKSKKITQSQLTKLIENISKYDKRVPEAFIDPVTTFVMLDPFLLPAGRTGNSYEGKSIRTWLQDHDTDPLTNEKATGAPISNTTLKKAIHEYLLNNFGIDVDRLEAPVRKPLDISKMFKACKDEAKINFLVDITAPITCFVGIKRENAEFVIIPFVPYPNFANHYGYMLPEEKEFIEKLSIPDDVELMPMRNVGRSYEYLDLQAGTYHVRVKSPYAVEFMFSKEKEGPDSTGKVGQRITLEEEVYGPVLGLDAFQARSYLQDNYCDLFRQFMMALNSIREFSNIRLGD